LLRSTHFLDKVVEALQPLFELFKNWAGVIDNAVWLASKTFTGLNWVATPTSVYLSGSHSALSAAHQCAQATGYECGSAGARLEAKNKAKYPKASEELEKNRYGWRDLSCFVEPDGDCHEAIGCDGGQAC